MRLVETGRLDLDAAVRRYLPRFSGGLKNQVTVRMLLDHTSGLKSYVPIYRRARRSRTRALDLLYAQPLLRPPGDSAEYSDLNAMLLGMVIEKVPACRSTGRGRRGIRAARACGRRCIGRRPGSSGRIVPSGMWRGQAGPG